MSEPGTRTGSICGSCKGAYCGSRCLACDSRAAEEDYAEADAVAPKPMSGDEAKVRATSAEKQPGLEEKMLRTAQAHAFATTLLILRLQGAALIATDQRFATREQFLQLAGDAYDSVGKMQQESADEYRNKFKSQVVFAMATTEGE